MGGLSHPSYRVEDGTRGPEAVSEAVEAMEATASVASAVVYSESDTSCISRNVYLNILYINFLPYFCGL
jgi:hypothetical protein